jgi:hypothetical protein
MPRKCEHDGLRYNPDMYYVTLKNGSKKQYNPSKLNRHKVLEEWLNYLMNLELSELKKYGYCSMIQLFYNNYKKGNVNHIVITDYEK